MRDVAMNFYNEDMITSDAKLFFKAIDVSISNENIKICQFYSNGSEIFM